MLVRSDQRLSSDLQVIAVQHDTSKFFALSLGIPVGMNDAPLGQPTVAHLLEHLAFAGENQRVIEQISERGANVTAFTHLDATFYHISGHVDLLPEALEFVANVFKPNSFSQDEFHREVGVMQSELVDAAPGQLHRRTRAHLRFHGRLVGSNNWRVSPRKEQRLLHKLTRWDTLAFQAKHYVPANGVLSVVSPMTADAICTKLESVMPTPATASATDEPEAEAMRPAKLVDWWYDSSSIVWMHLFHVSSDTSPLMRMVAQIIAHEMGGGMHSAMFKRFRRDAGIAYNATTETSCLLRQSMLSTFISLGHTQLMAAVSWVAERLECFEQEGISQEVHERQIVLVRRYLETEIANPQDMAYRLSYEGMRPPADRLLWSGEYLRLLETTPLSDLRAAARELLSQQGRSCFLGGNITPLQAWRIRRRLTQEN